MIHFYGHDEVILLKGTEVTSLIVLLRGEVCILSDEIFLVSRKAPSVLGEQAFIDEPIHSATVKAQGMVEALVLPKQTAEELMKDNRFVRNLLHVVSAKLRESTSERALHYRREQLLFAEFRAHASDEMVNGMLATGIDYGKPRQINNCVILFSDVRGFTKRSSRMSPEDIADQLSPYLDSVVDIIHKHGGIVDKFIGDGVLAIWGYATVDSDRAMKAFSCAQEMVRTAARMFFGGEPLSIGIGLNAGQVFIGNIGGKGKRQFTVLGSPVNLASRYEGCCKILSVPIVLGEAIRTQLPSDIQAQLVSYPRQPIEGAEPQTLYGFDPEILRKE